MITRRNFIKITGFSGGALILGFSLHTTKRAPEEIFELNAFLKIGSDNSIIIQSKNPEIGQGVKTSLPMIIAEELEVDWDKVIVEQAPYDQRLGSQLAGGSASVNTNWNLLRQVGASAKELLKMAASKKWNVELSLLKAESGEIINTANGKRFKYGELVELASSFEIPDDIKLKKSSEFKIIGRLIKGVDNEKIVTGSIDFGIDAEVDGMLYAAISKSPVFGGTVKSFDDSGALKVPGVKQVVQIDGNKNPTWWVSGVAVIADSTWAAFQGKKALEIEWDSHGNESESSDALTTLFKANVNKKGAIQVRHDGNIDSAFNNSDVIIEGEYELPFLSHASMEPMNYLAHVKEDEVYLIGSTQVPGSCRFHASTISGLDKEKVTTDVTRIGGGFGRRLFADYAAEAVFLSKKVGAPVKVVWTREDDIQHDYYRPAGIYKLRAAIKEGQITAWHTNASSTSRYLYRGSDGSPHRSEIFEDGFPAGFIPNYKIEYTAVETPIQTGAWRAPGHNSTSFVNQSFIDEVAHTLKKDPLGFRLELLGEDDRIMPYSHHNEPPGYSTARLKNVIKKVGAMSNWSQKPEKGIYRGIAAHYIFGSYVAEVCELSIRNGKHKIEKFYAAVDCGIIVNKSGALAQVEGGIIDGISITHYGEITIENGGAKQDNFDAYKLLRINEVPEIEIAFIESDEHPTGLGEISLPPVAPAICNAIFAAKGERIRKLPLG